MRSWLLLNAAALTLLYGVVFPAMTGFGVFHRPVCRIAAAPAVVPDCFLYGNGSMGLGRGLGYAGEFRNLRAHGHGRLLRDPHFVAITLYEGGFEHGLRHGNGIAYFPDGRNVLYDGEWANDTFDGTGTLYREDGYILYEGRLKAGKQHGFGRQYDNAGRLIYEGVLEQDKMHSHGTMWRADGKKLYVGSFVHGEIRGKGQMFGEEGNVEFDGEFADGKPEGWGRLYAPTGMVAHEGYWKAGLRHGRGKQVGPSGSVERLGEWVDGRFVEPA